MKNVNWTHIIIALIVGALLLHFYRTRVQGQAAGGRRAGGQ